MNPSLATIAHRYGIRPRDYSLAHSYVGNERADLVIAPDGNPYLYRWYVVPRNTLANVYFHIQVASDPERPLHDHPWDNTSVILVGGYHEQRFALPIGPRGGTFNAVWEQGGVINRDAELAHRLILPEGVPYTMTLFTTGPHRREWGFWYPDGWVSNKEVIEDTEGKSVWKGNL